MKSPPIGIQPTWFDEKSGKDARCCAAIPLVSTAPTRPVRMQWPRNPDLEVNLNILLLLAFTPSQKYSLVASIPSLTKQKRGAQRQQRRRFAAVRAAYPSACRSTP